MNFRTVTLQELKTLLNDKKRYIALFVAFFVLESVLALWTGHEYDTTVWFNTGKWISQGTSINLPPEHFDDPPYGLLMRCIIQCILILGVNLELWRFLIKLPMIIAHLALGFLVGRFAENLFRQKENKHDILLYVNMELFLFCRSNLGNK